MCFREATVHVPSSVHKSVKDPRVSLIQNIHKIGGKWLGKKKKAGKGGNENNVGIKSC